MKGGYASARGDLAGGYDASNAAINTGANNALGYLDAGTAAALERYGTARNDLTSAGAAFAPLGDLAGKFGRGADLYADATGINGAEGNARAQGAFTAAPGYDYTLNQGIDAINRRANAAGMLASGNADRDAIGYASNLANQGYQQWLQNLSPYNNLSLSATQGAASGNADVGKSLAALGQNEAGLVSGAGTARANIAQGQGNALSDIARAYYSSLGGLDTGQGSALAANTLGGMQNAQNVRLNIAPQYTGTYQKEADAANAASKAALDAIMGTANLALKASGVGGFGPASIIRS